jgi:hypothetical protein
MVGWRMIAVDGVGDFFQCRSGRRYFLFVDLTPPHCVNITEFKQSLPLQKCLNLGCFYIKAAAAMNLSAVTSIITDENDVYYPQ